MPASEIRPVELGDFEIALNAIRPSVSAEQLKIYEEWTGDYGSHA